jgi:predicted nucleotidyltransferase
MSLPDFNAEGDLPPGVYRATMEDVVSRFGSGSPERGRAIKTLQRIFELARATTNLDRMIVFGSFVTSKLQPNDVDVILVMRDEFRLEACPEAAKLLFDHAKAEQNLGASVFWIRPGLLISDTLDQFIQRWQLKRDGGRRGIVEVVG